MMRGLGPLYRRELFGTLVTPVAWVAGVLFLLVQGLVFWSLLALQSQSGPGTPLMALFIGSPFVWILQLVLPPVLTMRCFAEEARAGTLETLLTAPVTETVLVAAKYLAALTVYLLLWGLTLGFLAGFAALNGGHQLLDPGELIGGYGFLLLTGMLYLAVGVLASALSSHQMVAAILGFSMLALLFLAGLADLLVDHPGVHAVTRVISAHDYQVEFARGIVDTRPVVANLSATLWVLFVAVKRLQSRTWKV